MGEFNEAWRTVKANETSEGARTLVRAARPACLGNGGHGGFREWYPPWSPCFSVCSVRGLLLGSGEKRPHTEHTGYTEDTGVLGSGILRGLCASPCAP